MVYTVVALFLGLGTAAIAHSKGRSFFLWWLYGMAFFILALPHALLIKVDQDSLDAKGINQGQRLCPHCAELIREKANVCRFCGRDVKVIESSSLPQEDLQPAAKLNLQKNPKPDDLSNWEEVTNEPLFKISIGVLGFAFLASAVVFLNSNNTAPYYVTSATGQESEAQTTRSKASRSLVPLVRPETTVHRGGTALVVSKCDVINRHGFIAFLLCPSDATPSDWRAAGISACRSKRICTAWMWDNSGKVASGLPMTDAQVNSTVAVWVSATQKLSNCKSDGC